MPMVERGSSTVARERMTGWREDWHEKKNTENKVTYVSFIFRRRRRLYTREKTLPKCKKNRSYQLFMYGE